MEDIPFCIFWVYFLFLNWFRKWTERKCESLSILKTPTAALVTQGLRGSARMLNGFLHPPCSTNNPLVLFFPPEWSNLWVQFYGRGGWLGDSGSKEPAIGAYVCSFPIHHASWNSYLTTAQEWHARHQMTSRFSSQSFPTPLSLCPHTQRRRQLHNPCGELSFEEHKPVNQAQPTVSFSPGGPLSKDNAAVES